jgi:hypothetical protein
MREVVDGNGFFFLAVPGSGGGGGESEEETARKDTEQESNTAADPTRVVPREKYIPSPPLPPLFFRCVSFSFPLFLALAHKPVFCTNSVRNLYAITIPLLLRPLLCKRAIAEATEEQAAAATAAESHHQNLEQRRT